MVAPVVTPPATSRTTPPVLEICGLRTRFPSRHGTVNALDGIDLAIGRGEVVAVVGESGSGKSTTARSIMRLLPPEACMTADAIRLGELDLLSLSESEINHVRGRRIAMIFQQPRQPSIPLAGSATRSARRSGCIVASRTRTRGREASRCYPRSAS